MQGLKQAGVEIDRKVLAELAVNERERVQRARRAREVPARGLSARIVVGAIEPELRARCARTASRASRSAADERELESSCGSPISARRASSPALLRSVLGRCRPTERPGGGPRSSTTARTRFRRRIDERRGALAPTSARARARGAQRRRHAAGLRRAARPSSPAHAARRPRSATILCGLGFERRRRARDRGRLPQLRGAQHSRRSPGARHAGHLLRARAGGCCARTPRRCRSASWRRAQPPLRDHRAGRRLPPRRRRRDALADVPPGRGAAGRPRHHVRRT